MYNFDTTVSNTKITPENSLLQKIIKMEAEMAVSNRKELENLNGYESWGSSSKNAKTNSPYMSTPLSQFISHEKLDQESGNDNKDINVDIFSNNNITRSSNKSLVILPSENFENNLTDLFDTKESLNVRMETEIYAEKKNHPFEITFRIVLNKRHVKRNIDKNLNEDYDHIAKTVKEIQPESKVLDNIKLVFEEYSAGILQKIIKDGNREFNKNVSLGLIRATPPCFTTEEYIKKIE